MPAFAVRRMQISILIDRNAFRRKPISQRGELIKKHNHVKLEEFYTRKSEWFCLANWKFARWQDRDDEEVCLTISRSVGFAERCLWKVQNSLTRWKAAWNLYFSCCIKHSSFRYLADLRFIASYVRCNLSEGWNDPCFKPQLRIGKPEVEYNERTCVTVIVVLRSLYGDDCRLYKWCWNDLDESLCLAFPDRKDGDTSHLRRIVQRNWTASYLLLIEQKVDILSTYQAQYEARIVEQGCVTWKIGR